MFIFDYGAPGDSLSADLRGAWLLALSLHSRRHESARPLRNTAAAYSVPTLRARREAPSLVSGFGVGFALFQPAHRLVHWSIHAGCAKTTKTSADCQPARGDNKPLRRRIHG